MDRVVSTRLEIEIAETITRLARQLGVSKKSIVEEAIRRYAAGLASQGGGDVLETTSGAWARRQSAAEVAAHARRVFRRGIERHRR